MVDLEKWVISFACSSPSWKALSWFTTGNVTRTKQGEGLRSWDGDKRERLCSAWALVPGMFHLRPSPMLPQRSLSWLMSGCLCARFGQGELIWMCVMDEGVISAVGMLQVSGQKCLVLSISRVPKRLMDSLCSSSFLECLFSLKVM